MQVSWLTVFLSGILLLAQISAARADLDKASDAWLENLAQQDADGFADKLKELEGDIPITTDVKEAIKETIKSAFKRKIGENMINDVASPAMYAILKSIREKINAERGRNPCERAAINTAWSSLAVYEGLDGAAETLSEVVGAAVGAPALLREIVVALADKVRKEIEEALNRYMADYRLETFSRNTSVAGCSVAIRVVWNKVNGKFSFVVMGDCGCREMIFEGGQAKLSRWSISGEGTAEWVGDEVEREDVRQGKRRSSLKGGARLGKLLVRAICCTDENQPDPKAGVDPFDFRPRRQEDKSPPQDNAQRTATGTEQPPPRLLTPREALERNREAAKKGRVVTIPRGPVCEEQKAQLVQQAAQAKQAANANLAEAQAVLDQVKTRQRANEAVSDEELADAFEAVEIATERARLAHDALQKAEQLETKKCPPDEKHGFLPGSPLPDGQEYVMRFAVEIPEQCVATTYIFTETRVTETPMIKEGESGLSTPTETPETPEDESGIPECVSTPISVTPPVEAVPIDPGLTPPAEEVPPVVDEPTEAPPPAARQPPTETPPTQPPAEEPPPIVEMPPEEAPPSVRPPDEPDLGLVKAESRVVELVLTSVQTGEPVSSAVVKLLEPPPALPQTGQTDPASSNPQEFAGDVPAGLVDDEGRTELTLSDIQPIEKGVPLKDQAEASPEKVAAVTPKEKREIRIDTAPYKQFTLMANSQDFRLPQEIATLSDKICLKRKFKIADKPVLVIRVPEDRAVDFVRKVETSEVSFVEEDPCRKKEESSDPYFEGSGLWQQEFDNQWAIKRVGYDKGHAAFALNDKDKPVTVAVIDTGVDWYHPDLDASAFWLNPKEVRANGKDDEENGYKDDLIGWNFVEGNHLPWDYDGHGTFVTGVIAASRDNGIGIAGLNPSARIMVLKALDAFGRGHASMIAEAIIYAADNGAKIINLSLGGRGLTQIEQLAVNHAKDKGAILVVAAGNDGEEVSHYSPSGLQGVVAVSATDRNDRRAGFSNWGPEVDIAAPGIDVLSLRARSTDLLSYIQNVKYEIGKGVLGADRAYYRASGTSFAAPIVSGTLSLLLSRFPALTTEQAVRMVLQSARDIETPGVDNYTGFGLLDAEAALASDPDFFIDSKISGVKVIAGKDGNLLRVVGTTAADEFDGATLMLGRGAAPEKWLKVNKPIVRQISGGPIMDLPARFFSGAPEWTIRLITKHKNGSTREARFLLRLG
ncbi:MAG: S8 family peptidase [Hyphomicrobiales bacterium]